MKLDEHLHLLNLLFTVPGPSGPIPRSVNVFLVCCETVTLIDTGVAGSEAVIFSYLQGLGRKWEDVSRIILTHSHPDHIGSAAAIKRLTGCDVFAGAGEKTWIEDTDLQRRERPVPGFDILVGGPVEVDQVVTDGMKVPAGEGVTLEVLETPGHSRGSISLLFRRTGSVITGDAIPLPDDMPIYDDVARSMQSLEKLGSIPDVALLLESWREPCRDVAARIEEGMRWLRRVDGAVRSVPKELEGMDLCRRVVADLGLPPFAVNPLVARSLSSHRRQDRAAILPRYPG